MGAIVVSTILQSRDHTHDFFGLSRISIGTDAAAEMLTTVAICSSARTLSRGDTVISVLCVTKELALRDWTSLPWLIGDSITELHVESAAFDRSVHPEKTDSETIYCE